MPKKPLMTQKYLIAENKALRARLDQSEETLRAICNNETDALVVAGKNGDQLFTRKGADYSYRILIEEMNEGALTLTVEGVILFANRRFAEILKTPLEKVISSTIQTWIAPDNQLILQSLIKKGVNEKRHEQLVLIAGDGTRVPAYLSVSNLLVNEMSNSFCLVVTDLTEQKRSDAIAASEKLGRELLMASDQSRLALLSVIEEQKLTEASLRESEERYRTITQELSDYFYTVQIQKGHAIKTVHGQACKMVTGYTPEEFIADPDLWIRMVPEQECDRILEQIRNIQKGDKIPAIEHQIKRKDGNIRWVSDTPIMKVDSQGTLVSYDGIVKDITERKQAEKAIKASEIRYRRLFESAKDGILILDAANGHILDVNPFLLELLGFSKEQSIGKNLWELGTFKDIVVSKEAFVELLQKGYVRYENLPLKTAAGTLVAVEFVSNVYDAGGEKVIQCNIRDITERKKAEDREQLTREVLEMLNRTGDTRETICDILKRVKKSTGFEAVGLRLQEGNDFPYYNTDGFPENFLRTERYLCERDAAGNLLRDANGDPVLECLCGNIIRSRTDPTLPFFTRGGSFWTNCTTEFQASTTEKDHQSRTRNRCNSAGYESVALIPLRSGDKTIGLLQFNDHRQEQFTPETIRFFEGLGTSIGIALDREQAKKEIQSLAKFPLENPSPVLRISKDGELLSANPAAMPVLLHWNVEVGKKCPAPYIELIRKAWESGFSQTQEIQIESRFYSFVITPIIDDEYVNLYGQEITAGKKLEEQFRQVQKMEAVGQLAGGVAHDFNNLLVGVAGFADLMKSCAKDTVKVETYSQKIIDLAVRGGNLNKQLLAFARKGRYVIVSIHMHEMIDHVIDILKHTIDKRIEIKQDYKAENEIINADVNQIENTVLNMALNARDAMPQGGTLEFDTENVVLNEEYCRKLAYECKSGHYLLLSIKDTGMGMDKETQSHIFEPFFTTKEVGKGTGLGLSSVYGCVKQCGGHINIYSEPGIGTTFKIYFPLANDAYDNQSNTKKTERTKGAGHILLVDDEEAIREVVAEMLAGLGYTVTTCVNGEEAMQKFKDSHDTIDLVILDMIMPKMNGYDCFRHLQKIDKEVPVLISSGFSLTEEVQQMMKNGVAGFLEKPYYLEKLSKIIVEKIRKKYQS